MRKILLTLSVVAFALSASPAAAAAARPTLAVNPSAPVAGDSLVFTGCGYTPGVGVTVVVHSPAAISFFGSLADNDGCFSTAATENYVAQLAGDYTAESFQGRKKAAAGLSFSVS